MREHIGDPDGRAGRHVAARATRRDGASSRARGGARGTFVPAAHRVAAAPTAPGALTAPAGRRPGVA